MRSLMVLIDGWGDEPVLRQAAKSYFSTANLPNFEQLATWGRLHNFSVCAPAAGSKFTQEVVPGSLSCILRLLGVADACQPKSRSYLELLAAGGVLNQSQLVLRCNLVTRDKKGRLASFNGSLALEAQAKVWAKIRQRAGTVVFWPQTGYKNLLLVPDSPVLRNLTIRPPHESLGCPVKPLLADLRLASPETAAFLDWTDQLLQPYKQTEGELGFYPWGVSSKVKLPSFKSLYGCTGAIVGGIGLVRGIGLAMGMQAPLIPQATGDVDTDLNAKLKAALVSPEDFVLVHFNGTDEAAHRRNFREKTAFLEQIDKKFLGPLLQTAKPGLRIVICGDHATSSLTGRHTRGTVPFLAAVWQKQEDCLLKGWDKSLAFLTKGRKANG